MRRLGIILVFCALWATNGIAASRVSGTSGAARNGTVSVRAGTSQQQVRTKTVASRQSVRVSGTKQKTVSRTATTPQANAIVSATRALTNRAQAKNTRAAATNVIARATTTETRTGAEYEQCKSAYFECMDQFCQLKNDDYRRCSCSDRITSLQNARDKLTQAGEQLTAFNENLDIVGKTAAQAAAMNTASDGELALTKDKSASKALLTAIMNSIRGTDTKVENEQLSSLNSVDLSFDSTNSFGMDDIGQAVASYNGTALYSAVYPQCRTAVKSNCNDASLQRAVNAYLMAIEQDCNTVQTAINNKQKETHAAIRESSSMLDMARAENHKNHNADDVATCLTNVENAVLSEEVCGTNYHKCLDNGEYIDVTTGAPIAGVVDFYKLGQMLTFATGRSNADQKLAQNINNQIFVSNFEKRVKQFAEPALDKCRDDADTVWQEYLNKALLDIYYAQQSKVSEIKQGCFDFVSACYMNGSDAMTNAMQGLIAAQTTTLKPDTTKLNKSLCDDYIKSCNNMFDGDIVKNYIDNRHDTDSLSACRAVVQQCFDNYGGQNYENFYNPSSGLFEPGAATDWFTLYDNDETLVSPCAKQLATIDSCKDIVEEAFGGFDKFTTDTTIYQKYGQKEGDNIHSRQLRPSGIATEVYNQIIDILQTQCKNLDGRFMNVQNLELYSDNYSPDAFCEATFYNRQSRYYNVIGMYGDIHYTDSVRSCRLELNDAGTNIENPDESVDLSHNTNTGRTDEQAGGASALNPSSISKKPTIVKMRTRAGFNPRIPDWHLVCETQTTEFRENMCPRDYGINIDVQSWGACLCWENGGRRSNNGTSTRCVASFPSRPIIHYVNVGGTAPQQQTLRGLNNSCIVNTAVYYTDPNCTNTDDNSNCDTATTFSMWENENATASDLPGAQDWCTGVVDKDNRVCPFGVNLDNNNTCQNCPLGYAAASGSDVCCPTGYTYNTTTDRCTSSDGDEQPIPTSTSLMDSSANNQGFPEGN